MIYCFLVTLEGLEEVSSQGEYSCVAWHLEEQVHIVWHCHELSQRRSSQYGVVGRFEVSYFELDVLRPEVLFCTECDREGNLADRCRRISGNDAVEWGLAWGDKTHVVEAHLSQRTCKDQVEPASTINEYSIEFGPLDDCVEY